MSLKLTTWNAQNAFGDPGRAERAAEHMLEIAPDIAVFPEAYDPELPEHKEAVYGVVERLEGAGYQVSQVEYEDPNHYDMQHGFMGMSRYGEGERIRSGERNSLVFQVPRYVLGHPARVVGLHLDHADENKRQRQVQELFDELDVSHDPSNILTLLAGDYNALHVHTLSSRLLRTSLTSGLIRLLPPGKTREHAECLTQMATGETLKMFEAAGFRDVDVVSEGSAPYGLKLFQLDRVMAPADVVAHAVTVERHRRLSDHRAVTVNLNHASRLLTK